MCVYACNVYIRVWMCTCVCVCVDRYRQIKIDKILTSIETFGLQTIVVK